MTDEPLPTNREPYWVCHENAVAEGKLWYIDPATGLLVHTETYLQSRGYCCRSGCRHCPYGYQGAVEISP